MPRPVFVALLTLALASFSAAQRRHDPLNDAEINQLRETALEPEKRLKLYVDFARLRLATAEQVHADPKDNPDRPREVHDALQDFSTLFDELDDNVATYADRHDDIRKVLRRVIEGESEFRGRLVSLKNGLSREEMDACEFLITSTLDSIVTAIPDHRKLLQEQDGLAKKKKLNKGDDTASK
jgi:hypothetical protein